MNGYADDLAAVIEALDLKNATPHQTFDRGWRRGATLPVTVVSVSRRQFCSPLFPQSC